VRGFCFAWRVVARPFSGNRISDTTGFMLAAMTSTFTFFVGITVQVALGILQVSAAILFVYRWQRRSWRFSNVMKIREPLARAYCSLSAVERARIRMTDETQNKIASDHDRDLMVKYLEAAQEQIVNFSVEHFKAKFWLTGIENSQLDVQFDKLRLEWRCLVIGRSEGFAVAVWRREI
jgi:hypothetical protein